jgi:hypothetical protein
LVGDQWLDELEQRINQSRGVLAFLSPAFVESRYCGREVRYADALPRKIIPLSLEPTQLSGGLKFILHSVQTLSTNKANSAEELLAAIRQHAPETLARR